MGLWSSYAMAQVNPAVSFFDELEIGIDSFKSIGIWSNVYQEGDVESNHTRVDFYGRSWNQSSTGHSAFPAKVNLLDTSEQYINSDTLTFSSINVQNHKGVKLEGGLLLTTRLELSGGGIVLHGGELILDTNATVTKYSDQRYLTTDADTSTQGKLTVLYVDSLKGWIDLPIGSGENSYAPMRFKNEGDPDHFSFYVTDEVLEDGDSGSSVNFDHAQKSWHIEETDSGGSLVSIQLQHLLSQCTSNFEKERRFVSHFTGLSPNLGGDSLSYTKWDMFKGASTTDSILVGNITTDSVMPEAIITYRGSIRSFSPFTVRSYPMNPLPVTWLSFTGNWEQPEVHLHWSTASELNNLGFHILRSVDGENFNEIDFVASGNPGGNAATVSRYSIADHTIPKHYNEVFYRLKQEDIDGEMSFSKVVRLTKNRDGLPEYRVYPNPVQDIIKIFVNHHELESYNMTLYNVLGQRVFDRSQLSTGTEYEWNPHLCKGVYILTTTDQFNRVLFTKRILIE
jgi:hypothetical protein